MAVGHKAKELFTASEVAGFCQVDLKTIHNWAERGEIRHFRTPGRHLRFRRVDVLDFLRKYGYPIPEALQVGKPRVVVLHGDRRVLTAVRRALKSAFDVTTFDHVVDALLSVGAEPPDALVLPDGRANSETARIVSGIKSSTPLSHVRVVLYSNAPKGSTALLEAGASAHVKAPDTAALRRTLASLLGLGR